MIGNDSVFHFVSFRVKILVSPAGRVAVEVSHYDPFSPFRLDGVEMEHFGGGEYKLYMDRGLPSNISLIPRTSVYSSPDLWISAAG